LDEALQIENSLDAGYGPPVPAKPSVEILGDSLFKDKQLLKSCKVVQKELLKFPNRLQAVEKLNKLDEALSCKKKRS
jgi:hypothetical protein